MKHSKCVHEYTPKQTKYKQQQRNNNNKTKKKTQNKTKQKKALEVVGRGKHKLDEINSYINNNIVIV